MEMTRPTIDPLQRGYWYLDPLRLDYWSNLETRTLLNPCLELMPTYFNGDGIIRTVTGRTITEPRAPPNGGYRKEEED